MSAQQSSVGFLERLRRGIRRALELMRNCFENYEEGRERRYRETLALMREDPEKFSRKSKERTRRFAEIARFAEEMRRRDEDKSSVSA